MNQTKPTSVDPDEAPATLEPGGARVPASPPTPASLAWAGLVLGLVVLALLNRQSAFLVDDAFITFRYARNWSDWGAPVFSSFELADGGRPVEGYSNFLWMAVLSLVHSLGQDLVRVGPLLQLVLAAASLAAIGAFARGPLRLGIVGTLAAPILLATAAPFVVWSSGGMETTLFTLVLFAFFAEALRRPANAPARSGLLLGALGGAIVLVRVEGALWALGTLGAVALAEALRSGAGLSALTQRRSRFAVALAVTVVVLGAHVAWRRALYGEWLPNTVAAKSGGAGGEVWARGWRQVSSWGLVTLTPIVAVLLALPAILHRERRAAVAALAALFTSAGFAAYNVVTGGDWMPFFRFLAPAAPLLALMIAVGVDRLDKRVGAVVAVAIAALQPLALFDVHLAPLSVRESNRFRSFQGGYSSERGRIESARVNREYFTMLGHALAAGTQPGDVLSFGAIGSPGWHAKDVDFVDINGLITPEVARLEIKRGGTAGHEKRVPHAWFLDNGTPEPNLLFAAWLKGTFSDLDDQPFQQAKQYLRQTARTARKPERPLFERTILRAIPVDDGPAAGCTLILLQRASREAAGAFWR